MGSAYGGGLPTGGSASRWGLPTGVCLTPLELRKQAVRILLKCFLVNLYRSISIYFGSYIRNSITFSVNALLVIPPQLMLNEMALMSK